MKTDLHFIQYLSAASIILAPEENMGKQNREKLEHNSNILLINIYGEYIVENITEECSFHFLFLRHL